MKSFRNALHAPAIASNLISMSVLDNLGWTMIIGKGVITFREPGGQEVFEGRMMDGLYLIEGSFMGSAPTALTAKSLISPGDQNLVDGLDLTEGEVLKCEDCTIANQKRRPFDGEGEKEQEPLERVYLDIFGPSRVPSVGGNRYAMVIVDGATAKKTSYFTPNRTAEITLGNLDDDNAPEFRRKIWAEWFKKHGIIHEFTTDMPEP